MLSLHCNIWILLPVLAGGLTPRTDDGRGVTAASVRTLH